MKRFKIDPKSPLALEKLLAAKYNARKSKYPSSIKRRIRVKAIKQHTNPKIFEPFFLSDSSNDNIEVLCNHFPDKKISNHGVYYKRNEFMIDSMIASGGGEINELNQCCDYIRIGNSTYDQLLYIAQYQGLDMATIDIWKYKKEISEKLFGKNYGFKTLNKILTPDEVFKNLELNSDANPGWSKKYLGYKNKRKAYNTIRMEFKKIYFSWTDLPKSRNDLQLYYTLASRPKLMSIDVAYEKEKKNKALGRSINMLEEIEQFISFPIWEPLFKKFLTLNKHGYFCGPLLGIHRNSVKWEELGRRGKNYDRVLTSDYSCYDTMVPGEVMMMALDIMLDEFDDNDMATNAYKFNYKTFFINNILNKKIIVRDKMLIHVKNGIPSGMLFTSLLGSICNYIMLYIILKKMKIEEFEIFTYGDDNIIYYNIPKKFKNKKDWSSLKMKKNVSFLCNKLFGMINKVDGMVDVSTKKMRVTYDRPIFKPGKYLEKGTRNLKPIKIKHYNSYSKIKTYDHSKGTTHRWNYNFKNKPNFLSYYFDEHYRPIRPSFESITRLVNPESQNVDLITHYSMLQSCLYDNIWNHHTVNHLYFYINDVFHMMKNCYKSSNGSIRLKKEFKLCIKNNEYTKNFRSENVIKNLEPSDRMYLRRINHYVDERTVPELMPFNLKFENLKKKAKRNYYEPIDEKRIEMYELQKNLRKFQRLDGKEKQKLYDQFGLFSKNVVNIEALDLLKKEEDRDILKNLLLTYFDMSILPREKYKTRGFTLDELIIHYDKLKTKLKESIDQELDYYDHLTTFTEKKDFILWLNNIINKNIELGSIVYSIKYIKNTKETPIII